MSTKETKPKEHPHKGHRQRFKNKALQGGIKFWPPHEVMELLLMYCIPQKDVNPIGHDLINKFGSISNVLNAGYDQLIKINGISHESALFLSLLPQIFQRYQDSLNDVPESLTSPYKCVEYFKKHHNINNHEDFYVLCLDNKKRVVKTVTIKGAASFVEVPITKFVQEILFETNKSVVIIHTHPAGDCRPSTADIVATKRLAEAAHAIGVKFDDHIIISQNEFYSILRDNDGANLISTPDNTNEKSTTKALEIFNRLIKK
jgi:DNA repair protein RadC